jgi:hypothetical protein
MTDPQFSRGGYIPGPPVELKIGDAECILRAADVREGSDVCWRVDPGHFAAIGETSVPHRPHRPEWTISAEAEAAIAALAEIRKRPLGPSPDLSESTP